MHEKPKLACTRDYSIFEMHPCNRPLHEDERLVSSMQRAGFMPSSPVQCVRNGNGKLKIIRGHHRLDVAKRLKLPVWYIVDDTKIDIFDLEGGRQAWTAHDFLVARARDGHADCARVVDFKNKHGLTLGAAASLMGGESAGSSNKIRAIKNGTFKLAGDLTHANSVVDVVGFCRGLNIAGAGSSAFVAAVSMCLQVREFDVNVFKHRARLNGAIVRKRGTKDECLDELDALYNYGAKTARLPLAFKAKELSRSRRESFGGKRGPGKKAARK